MNLAIDKWGSFRIADLFPVLQNGKANQGMLSDGNECFYVGAKKDDNGVMIHCAYDEDLVQKGNCIIFICNGQGSVGYANYMDVDFIGTTDIVAGYNDNLNQYNGLFISTILCQERPKYSFGRKWKTHLRDTSIKLPQTSDGKPDWVYMEQYIKSLSCKEISTVNTNQKQALGAVGNWKEYRLGDLFSQIYRADAHVKTDYEFQATPFHGSIPFVSRTDENNGCDCYIPRMGLTGIEEGNAIIIGDTTATSSYQPDSFVCGDHIVVCRANWMNVYTALFVVSLLQNERYRYSDGRAFKMQLISETIIKLPATEDGCPDWTWVENFVKSLPYGDRI